MHVAEIAPPWFPIPPRAYGGIERVVYDVTEGLVAAGQTVTLFAPGGSQTSGHLIETGSAGVGLDHNEEAKHDHFLRNGHHAYAQAVILGANLIHDHTDFPLPIVRTIHGPAADPHVARYVAMSARGDRFLAISERPYFDAVVRPALRKAGRQVEFVGEVGGAAKEDLIGRAQALIFSSPWEEPFGLVLTEAGAHGTPVFALRRGAAPEIEAEGVNGFLAADLEEFAQVLPAAIALDPATCRAYVAAHFDRPGIARQLVKIFASILAETGAVRPLAAA